MIRVERWRDGDRDAWQDYVDRSSRSGPLHHAGWHAVLEQAFAVVPLFLLARDAAGSVRGILPLYFSASAFTGRHLSSLEDGILADDAAVAAALFDEAIRLRDVFGAGYLQLRGGDMPEAAPGQTMRTVRTIIDVGRGAEGLWRALPKKTRNAVRRARKEGYAVAFDHDLGRLATFYRLYARRLHDLGTPVFGAEAMQAIANQLGRARLRLLLVERAGDPVGGMVCILNGRRWTDYFAVVARESLDDSANYLLYWSAIERAADEGAVSFDLGRSTPGSGNHRFKRKWAGEDREIVYGYYLARPSRAPVGLRKAASGRTLQQTIWSTLPLPVCNRLGPVLRRRLPFL